MRKLVVPVRVNVDTDGHTFVNSAGASQFVPQNGTTCHVVAELCKCQPGTTVSLSHED